MEINIFFLLVLPFRCIFYPLIKVKEFDPEDHQINISVIYFIINMVVVKAFYSSTYSKLAILIMSTLCKLPFKLSFVLMSHRSR